MLEEKQMFLKKAFQFSADNQSQPQSEFRESVKELEQLRIVTKPVYNDLNSYFGQIKGEMPTFGYPSINFDEEDPSSSVWGKMYRNILQDTSVKELHLKRMLKAYKSEKAKDNKLLTKFGLGQKISIKDLNQPNDSNDKPPKPRSKTNRNHKLSANPKILTSKHSHFNSQNPDFTTESLQATLNSQNCSTSANPHYKSCLTSKAKIRIDPRT
ncbi:unnamed protein product [Moneuplotes crassus]|uniref:Uncharacterized protein n=1 Tax=Euplotes crassus TaxID=5936 RepID=A0AAD1UMR9_EUPCR|nr:unnamed protein product [Moneuplotes crassus]